MSGKILILLNERGWILEEIAKEFSDDLNEDDIHESSIIYNLKNIEVNDISTILHVYYLNGKVIVGKRNIFYVTHIDSIKKILLLFYFSHFRNVFFICMSTHTKNYLKGILGGSNIFVKTPKSFHFTNGKPEKLTFGLFFRLYNDGRKNESYILNFFRLLTKYPSEVSVVIYGQGFDEIFGRFTQDLEIAYSKDFDVANYESLMRKCDYVVSFGLDEGYYSSVDAAALGVKIIGMNQGFHRDICLTPGSKLAGDIDELLGYIELQIEQLCRPSLSNTDWKLVLHKGDKGRLAHYLGLLRRYINLIIHLVLLKKYGTHN